MSGTPVPSYRIKHLKSADNYPTWSMACIVSNNSNVQKNTLTQVSPSENALTKVSHQKTRSCNFPPSKNTGRRLLQKTHHSGCRKYIQPNDTLWKHQVICTSHEKHCRPSFEKNCTCHSVNYSQASMWTEYHMRLPPMVCSLTLSTLTQWCLSFIYDIVNDHGSRWL